MEKQHNRGQDGAGLATLKLNIEPGNPFLYRLRSNAPQPIADLFYKIGLEIQELEKFQPEISKHPGLMKGHLPFMGEILLGHLRYGTQGKNNVEFCHPFIKRNLVPGKNIALAGNFNLVNTDELFNQIKDSKKLSFKKRSILAEYIKEKALTYGIGTCSAKEIDEINILQASIKAMHRALFKAYKNKKFTSILVDGNYFKPIISPDNDDDIIEFNCITKGDQTYINIAAASILAKDHHDKEIIKIVNENPDLNKYDLLKNMGYATLNHRNAIIKYGIHDLHRKTF
jgi:ribonuclease HII